MEFEAVIKGMSATVEPTFHSFIAKVWPRTKENRKVHQWAFGEIEASIAPMKATVSGDRVERDEALQLVCGFSDVVDFY